MRAASGSTSRTTVIDCAILKLCQKLTKNVGFPLARGRNTRCAGKGQKNRANSPRRGQWGLQSCGSYRQENVAPQDDGFVGWLPDGASGCSSGGTSSPARWNASVVARTSSDCRARAQSGTEFGRLCRSVTGAATGLGSSWVPFESRVFGVILCQQ